MKILLKNILTLSGISPDVKSTIMKRLTFVNPKWLENEKAGRSNFDTERLLRFYKETGDGLKLPRGFTGQLIDLCRRFDIKYTLDDQRRVLPEIDITFAGSLKPFQEEATTAMLRKDFGTLSAPTGSGKTIVALSMIAERRQPALVVLHTKELLNQWVDRIESFLNITREEIGVIGAGKKTLGDKITVALVQSLYKCAAEVSQHIGHLIIDECHRAPSRTFTEAVSAFDCRYMVGLSATPWRRDKLSKLIFWFVGDVAHSIETADLVDNGDILKATVIWRETEFRAWSDPSTEYSKMLSELTENRDRNLLISEDIAEEVLNGGGICLVLSDRKAHCEALREILANEFNVSSGLLIGDLSDGERKATVENLNDGRIKVLVATGQLIGEGFDLPAMQTLFLTTPIKFDGRVIQYLGRILRPAPGKEKATVYDYVDSRVGVLAAAAKSREKVYARN